MELSTQDIKAIISKSLSQSGISNKSIENVFRQIIFTEATGLDWQKIWKTIVLEQMPEFRNENYLREYLKDLYT